MDTQAVADKIKKITYAMIGGGCLFALIAVGVAISNMTSNPVQGAFFDGKGGGSLGILTALVMVLLISELVARSFVTKTMMQQAEGQSPESLADLTVASPLFAWPCCKAYRFLVASSC